MRNYLTSVFRVLYEVSTEAVGVNADELAAVTADQAFQEADTDRDGRISFEEFEQWYKKPGGFEVNKDLLEQTQRIFSLSEVRRLTNLEKYSPMHVFETLAEYANDEGNLTREIFMSCFRQFAEAPDEPLSKEDSERLDLVLSRLFDIFDADQNGLVDFSEISSGISVLCGGAFES